jgi:hypothetical protein
MPRLRLENSDRETTTTRVYVDTVRILKMLAEAQDLTLADYIDELARRAAREDGQRILDVLAQAQEGGHEAKGTKKK